MDKRDFQITREKLLRTVSVTMGLNTVVALILNYLVLDKADFWMVFVISQLMGLSICSCVTVAIHLGSGRGMAGVMMGTVLGLAAGVLFGALLSGLYIYFYGVEDVGKQFREMFSQTAVIGVLVGIPATYFFYTWSRIQASERKIQEEKIKRLTLQKESAMITLKLMQAQIEPHFLFNTLSNVASLLDIDIGKAKKMLEDINAYLRISLQRTRQEMVTLGQEVELVTRYLDIFKIRMGQRLTYEINVDAQAREIPFPPLILQPLVENAIQYGLEPKAEGGRITVDGTLEKHALRMVIADTGMGFEAGDGRAGIGLNNVSTRLESIYGKKATLTLKEARPSGAIAIIEVPL